MLINSSVSLLFFINELVLQNVLARLYIFWGNVFTASNCLLLESVFFILPLARSNGTLCKKKNLPSDLFSEEKFQRHQERYFHTILNILREIWKVIQIFIILFVCLFSPSSWLFLFMPQFIYDLIAKELARMHMESHDLRLDEAVFLADVDSKIYSQHLFAYFPAQQQSSIT